jgi:PAS domain S-box-containing protein
MADAKGNTTYCNRRVAEYFGVAGSELPAVSWRPRFHPDDVDRVFAAWWHSVETLEPFQVEYRLRRHDGQYRTFLVRALPLRNEAGELERWIGSSTDIHDQKLAEDALRRSEKLATAGRLAASIAHEINNPLAAVTNSLYLALQDDSLRTDTKMYLRVAEEELQRVSHITTQSLRFHKQSNSAMRVDICDIVESVLVLFRHRLANKNIEIQSECERGAFVNCFADEVRQVIANLISNSLDATGAGGRIRVRVKTTGSHTQQRPVGVRIVVGDTGHGIPSGVAEHIFEPFVSTKNDTGIGLGLWVSEGIVRKHGGQIKVRSRHGGRNSGTTFRVFLPDKPQ